MAWLSVGLLAGVVAAVWLIRRARLRAAERSGRACPECGGDLRGYEQSPTCPHCYATLDGDDDEEGDADEPDSADEVDEDFDTPQRW